MKKWEHYEKAAKAFEAFAKANPKDPVAINFRYNAAITFDALNQYNNSVRNFKIYYNQKKGSEKFEALFLLGALYERLKNYDLALNYYDQYIKSGTVDGNGVVNAAFSIAKIHQKRRNKKIADEWFQKTVNIQKNLARKGKVVGEAFAAESKFNLVDDIYYELIKIKIPGSTKTQGKVVERKLTLLNKLKESLKDVIAYNDGFQIIAALNLQGQALYHMYISLLNAPKPKGLNKEELKQYNDGIESIANPFKKQALETLQLTIKRGYKLQAYNDSLIQAIDRLDELEDRKERNLDFKVKLVTSVDDLGLDWTSKAETIVLEEVAEKLSKDSKDLKILNALGVYYLNKSKPRLAKILFNRALESHPKEKALYNNLGVISIREKDIRSALSYFGKSLSFDNYRIATQNISSIYIKYKDYIRALPSLKFTYKNITSNLNKGEEFAVAVANNYAVALMGSNSGDKAKPIFKAILKSGNRDAEVHLNYAILLLEILNKKIDGQRILSKIQFMTDNRSILKKVEDLENNARQ